jgi:calreticulin
MMLSVLKAAILSLAAVKGEVYYKETFETLDAWETSGDGKVVLSAGDFFGDAEDDKGMQTSQDARFYHVSASHPEFSNKGKDLVISFSVKHGQDIDCGGGYLKFLPAGLDRSSFNGDSEYNIMFGPDICGATKKVHVILNYKGKNVLNDKLISAKTDSLTHTYTLILKKDNTFEVQIDGEEVKKGDLKDEKEFQFLKPKEIKDPDQSKPGDWVDDAMMDDPEDVKPEGYDDIPKMIADPEAEKPEDWDEEDDGEWEAPEIDNPEYKGPWSPKRIENPDYVGPWEHPMIPNPEFEDDDEIYAFDSFGAVGLDVWQVKSGSIFDNIIIADNIDEVNAFIKEHDHKEAEKAAKEKIDEEERERAEAERQAAEEAAAAEEDEDDDDDDDEDVDEAIENAKEEL